MKKPLVPLGWREWVQLPDVTPMWIKAKVDTGARSSSLHAFNIELFDKEGVPWIRFAVHPHQRTRADATTHEAPVLEMRSVKSSSGVSEERPVIRTPLMVGGVQRDIELTLTGRDAMGFRMLLGRQALRGSFLVDPDRAFLTGVPPTEGQREPLRIGGAAVQAGDRKQVDVHISKLASGAEISLPVIVVHGAQDGPTVWLSAAIHGDEINGVEIIRRVLQELDPEVLRGTVLAVPTVNVHGFGRGDRYLPDRRDLNRSFPGSARGSLARRIAHLLMTEVVERCSVGIDLHTGSDGRTNLPQIRADLDDPKTAALASAFGCPLMLHSAPRPGTLRHAGIASGAQVLLFEGGEALRFDRVAIEAGRAGVLRVLAELDLIEPVVPAATTRFLGAASKWVRARRSGLVQLECDVGDEVVEDQVLGFVNDSGGTRLSTLKSPSAGIVIGLKLEPLVNRGDAIVHVAVAAAQDPS